MSPKSPRSQIFLVQSVPPSGHLDVQRASIVMYVRVLFWNVKSRWDTKGTSEGSNGCRFGSAQDNKTGDIFRALHLTDQEKKNDYESEVDETGE
jgi:hypothetical protein